jgi:hypothetical protein
LRILGIDFTSSPRRRKPLTCLQCTLEDGVLEAGELEELASFEPLECALRKPGPWIAGLAASILGPSRSDSRCCSRRPAGTLLCYSPRDSVVSQSTEIGGRTSL